MSLYDEYQKDLEENKKKQTNLYQEYLNSKQPSNNSGSNQSIQTPKKQSPNIFEQAKSTVSGFISGVGNFLNKGGQTLSALYDKAPQAIGEFATQAVYHLTDPVNSQDNDYNQVLLKSLEDKHIRLEQESKKPKPDQDKIKTLQDDIQEINYGLDLKPSNWMFLSEKSKLATKYGGERFINDIQASFGQAGSSMLDYVTKSIEEGQLQKEQLYSGIKDEKLRKELSKSPLIDKDGKVLTRELSKNIKKWTEEVNPRNPDFLDALANGTGSMATFVAVAYLSKGNAVVSAMAEAMQESGSVYETNREKGKSIEESSIQADKDFYANLIINYATDKFGILSDRQRSGIRKAVFSASAEGLQEASQQIASNSTTDEEMMNGVFESFAIGGILGGTFSQLGFNRDSVVENTGNVQTQTEEVTPNTPTGTRRLLKVEGLPDTVTGKSVVIRPDNTASFNLEVSESERGKGVGSSAVKTIESAIYKEGVTEVRIPVKEESVGFFEKQGYVATGEKENGLVPMSKTLTAENTTQPTIQKIEKQGDIQRKEGKGLLADYDLAVNEGNRAEATRIANEVINSTDPIYTPYKESMQSQLNKFDIIFGKESSTNVTDQNKINEIKKQVELDKSKQQPIQTVSRTKEEIAKIVTDNEVKIKDVYTKNQDKVDQAMYEVFTQMEVAEAGYRYKMSDGEWGGMGSTFPKWVPEHLRSRKLFDKVLGGLRDINNLKYPQGKAQRELYDYILDEIDSSAGVDTKQFREAIINTYEEETQSKKTEKATDKGVGRSKARVGQESAESYGSGMADKGNYDTINDSTKDWYGLKDNIELPEMIGLYKELTGSFPQIKSMSNALGKAIGKKIQLNPLIFKNNQFRLSANDLVTRVLAHEIGHVVDYLPDNTMKRGNILGRIAKLVSYRKRFIQDSPTNLNELISEDDKKRLRKEAKAIAELKSKGEYVEKTVEIVKEEKAPTPEEILKIWNDGEARIKDPQLLSYVQKLDNVQKKEIVKQAMKGDIPAWVDFKRQVKETITQRVFQKAPKNIKEVYQQLFEAEIKKRQLIDNLIIRDELIKLTNVWKPFDPTIDSKYTAYRYSSAELYADAVSVLFNNPTLLKEKAPTFYSAFFSYLDKTPQLKTVLMETYDLLQSGQEAILTNRDKTIDEMFKKGEDAFRVAVEKNKLKKKSLVFRLKTELIDNNNIAIDYINRLKKQGIYVSDEDNIRYTLESFNYVGGVQKAFVEEYFDPIYRNIQKDGLSWEDLGKVLFLQRAINERGEMANPLGQNSETAKAQLDYYKNIYGENKYNKLIEYVEKFREGTKYIIDIAEKERLFSPELISDMKANPAYATFQVIDYITENISPLIRKQTGTFKEITNPASATLNKSLGIIRAVERNKVKREWVQFLNKYFKEELQVADTRWNGRYDEAVEPKDPNLALFTYVEDGKTKGFYVDPYVAKTMEYMSTGQLGGVLSILNFTHSKYFRPMFITLNLGFQSVNLVRDFLRAYKALPTWNPLKVARYYAKALPAAKARAWEKSNAEILKLEKEGVLSVTYNDIIKGLTEEETQVDYLIGKVGLSPLKTRKKNFFYSTGLKVLDFIERSGNLVETLPKVAGYNLLQGKLPPKELRSFIRTSVGSPDFLRKGSAYPAYNEVFLFANAIKEGWRADYNVAFKNPNTRSGYWFKTAAFTLMPKTIMYAALMGLLGDQLKKMFEDATEYDKTNYLVVPFARDHGITGYLRLPQDETSKLIGGIYWKFLTSFSNQKTIPEDLMSMAGYVLGTAPNLSPFLKTIGTTKDFVSGKNPFDDYRGRFILQDDEFKAGGMYALKPFLTWQLQNLGGNIFWNFSVSEQAPETKSWVQKTVEAPVLSNLAGRWIRFTNYGSKEQNKEVTTVVQKEQAVKRLEDKKVLDKYLSEYKKGDQGIFARRELEKQLVKEIVGNPPYKDERKRKANNTIQKFRYAIIKGNMDPDVNTLIEANSNAEKEALLKVMKQEKTQTEYVDFLKEMVKQKIISLDLARSVK